MDWMKWVHGVTKQPSTGSLRTGDDVRVWFKIREQDRERLAQFEGVVIRYRGSGSSKTITVRRVTYGEGVERVFPLDAPVIERIEVLRHGKVKRSRLYFLRAVVKRVRLETAQQGGSSSPSSQDTRTVAVPSEEPMPSGSQRLEDSPSAPASSPDSQPAGTKTAEEQATKKSTPPDSWTGTGKSPQAASGQRAKKPVQTA